MVSCALHTLIKKSWIKCYQLICAVIRHETFIASVLVVLVLYGHSVNVVICQESDIMCLVYIMTVVPVMVYHNALNINYIPIIPSARLTLCMFLFLTCQIKKLNFNIYKRNACAFLTYECRNNVLQIYMSVLVQTSQYLYFPTFTSMSIFSDLHRHFQSSIAISDLFSGEDLSFNTGKKQHRGYEQDI
jgi:hypothetical protein